MVVNLAMIEQAVATLRDAATRPDELSDRDRSTLKLVADAVGSALFEMEDARLAEALRDVHVEHERRLISISDQIEDMLDSIGY